MPFYLATFSYTPEAWSQLITKPEDRREVIRALAEGVDSSCRFYYCLFSRTDVPLNEGQSGFPV
jgi:hypothetical protein